MQLHEIHPLHLRSLALSRAYLGKLCLHKSLLLSHASPRRELPPLVFLSNRHAYRENNHLLKT